MTLSTIQENAYSVLRFYQTQNCKTNYVPDFIFVECAFGSLLYIKDSFWNQAIVQSRTTIFMSSKWNFSVSEIFFVSSIRKITWKKALLVICKHKHRTLTRWLRKRPLTFEGSGGRDELQRCCSNIELAWNFSA